MRVTAWKWGNSPAYGLKLSVEDRDAFFSKDWTVINLKVPDGQDYFSVNIAKKSFWNNTCRELIHKEIGNWLKRAGLLPWEKGHPPKFELLHEKDNNFLLVGNKFLI